MLNQQKLVENLTRAVKRVLEAQQAAVVDGMNNLQADMKDRIFLNGLDVVGAPIGQYSTKPMYASLKGTSQVRSSSLRGKGKFSNSPKFKNGNSRKSMYLAGGYSEYRTVVGRQNSTVDLNLTGSMQKDIRLGSMDNAVVLSFTTDTQLKKAAGNETRFGKTIFSASELELDGLVKNWQAEVSQAFYESFV